MSLDLRPPIPVRTKRRLHLESLEQRAMLHGGPLDLDLPLAEGEAAPTFTGLEDVNPASDSFEQTVSVSDFQGQVTGWYFGYAT